MVIGVHHEDRAQLWVHLERESTEHAIPSRGSKPPANPSQSIYAAVFRFASIRTDSKNFFLKKK